MTLQPVTRIQVRFYSFLSPRHFLENSNPYFTPSFTAGWIDHELDSKEKTVVVEEKAAAPIVAEASEVVNDNWEKEMRTMAESGEA